MQKRLFTTVFAVIVALGIAVAAPTKASDETSRIVVELFTSQGCGACPPANAYLSELAKHDDILALSWNVDYWDYKGWTDTLARPESSRRQRRYNARLGRPGVYTPEMVIQGSHHLRGSDREAIEALLGRIRREPPAQIGIQIERDETVVKIRLEDRADGEHAVNCDILLVQYSPSKTIPIRAGDNDGVTITYTNIVDRIETIGTWTGQAVALRIATDRLGKEGNVILLQDGAGGPIQGAKIIGPESPGS